MFLFLARIERRENCTHNKSGGRGPLNSDTKALVAGTCPKSGVSVLLKQRGEVRSLSLKDR